MSWTSSLLAGIALHIDAAGLAKYRPSSAYAASDIALVLGTTPPQPDRCVVIAQYGTVRPRGLAEVAVSVQFKTRGTPADSRSADDVFDPIRDLLDHAEGLTLGGIQVPLITVVSGTELYADANGRPVRTDNLSIIAERPTPNRPD